MNQDVQHFALPDDASSVDRITLRVWKVWAIWVRPILLATALMVVVSIAVGTTVAKSGGIANGFVAVWSPANYSAVANLSNNAADTDLSAVPVEAWTRGIVAQFLSVLAAAALAVLVLRRTVHATVVGAISGLVVVVWHLTVSNQWTSQPIVGAPGSYQAVALVGLWLLPVVTYFLGRLFDRRSAV